ncbi:MAG TPA: CPBP family intramembrane glutamic endopeptidase [Acidimicrobiia bacterium]|nr:CPBP family intramembrane glutamic endopeptidase [Acidimicrobiia bacterium]
MDEPRPWRVMDAVVVFVAGTAAATAAYLAVGDATVLAVFGVIIPAQLVGMVLALAALVPRRKPWRESFRWSVRWSDLVGLPIGLGIQVVLALLVGSIASAVEIEIPTQEVIDSAAAAGVWFEWVLVAVGLVVLGPLVEEVLFRGVLLRALERRSRFIAVYGSALLFAAAHAFDPAAWFMLPSLFVLGVVLGYEVLRTGRLGRVVAIHAGFNSLALGGLIVG